MLVGLGLDRKIGRLCAAGGNQGRCRTKDEAPDDPRETLPNWFIILAQELLSRAARNALVCFHARL
jgi:hypothetical protein